MVARQDAARRIEASFGFSVRIERSGLIEGAVFVMLSSPAWLPIDEVGSVVLRQVHRSPLAIDYSRDYTEPLSSSRP
jgi:hypothetical protein